MKIIREANLITSSWAKSCIRLFKLPDVSETDSVSVMRVLMETGSVTLVCSNHLAWLLA